MKNDRIESLLKEIDARISHMEDMTADNRAIIVKLVKQTNQIVQYLKELEISIVEDENLIDEFSLQETPDSNKLKNLSTLFEEYLSQKGELKELEEELKKHKDNITPGQVGEA